MFSHLELMPADPIYGMQVIFKKDTRQDKVNLSIGVCLDEQGKSLYMKAVAKATLKIAQKKVSKEYLAITGHTEFCRLSQELIFGKQVTDELATIQSIGGTGGLYLAAKLAYAAGIRTTFVSDPSWPNHKPLFQAAGHFVASYPYYKKKKASFDFEGLLGFIPKIPSKSAIILQASCHNPTGIDPTIEQWKTLSAAIKKQNLLVIFDLAYLGLGSGLDEDVAAIRQFQQDGHEMLVVTTYSKTFGLYNDRIATLSVAAKKESLEKILSNLRVIARSCYSSPPANGAEIIRTILDDVALRTLWKEELDITRMRLGNQRKCFYDALVKHQAQIGYDQILRTKGLFCLFDLTAEQVLSLQHDHGIYLALDGRVSLATITYENASRVAEKLSQLAQLV